ncbi:hypothetical protein CEXT_579131 [Caerostris extrusa]|uniref:Uncharacterized protein n=1 Tax=Caerostris extrusa TaxID=172846 RepID=A0AAV4TTT6_CAEEX|nr:hypothetical protein CEXT_579131 [Caerostris extrusa]
MHQTTPYIRCAKIPSMYQTTSGCSEVVTLIFADVRNVDSSLNITFSSAKRMECLIPVMLYELTVGILLKSSLISSTVSSEMGFFLEPGCLTIPTARNLSNHVLTVFTSGDSCLYVLWKFRWREILLEIPS